MQQSIADTLDDLLLRVYGPRLFGMRSGINQVANVIKLLRRKPSSRQAVVQLFNAEDLLKDYKDIFQWQLIEPRLCGDQVARALKPRDFIPVIFFPREPEFLRSRRLARRAERRRLS